MNEQKRPKLSLKRKQSLNTLSTNVSKEQLSSTFVKPAISTKQNNRIEQVASEISAQCSNLSVNDDKIITVSSSDEDEPAVKKKMKTTKLTGGDLDIQDDAELQNTNRNGFLNIEDQNLRKLREVFIKLRQPVKTDVKSLTELPPYKDETVNDQNNKDIGQQARVGNGGMTSVHSLSLLPPMCKWCQHRKPVSKYDSVNLDSSQNSKNGTELEINNINIYRTFENENCTDFSTLKIVATGKKDCENIERSHKNVKKPDFENFDTDKNKTPNEKSENVSDSFRSTLTVDNLKDKSEKSEKVPATKMKNRDKRSVVSSVSSERIPVMKMDNLNKAPVVAPVMSSRSSERVPGNKIENLNKAPVAAQVMSSRSCEGAPANKMENLNKAPVVAPVMSSRSSERVPANKMGDLKKEPVMLSSCIDREPLKSTKTSDRLGKQASWSKEKATPPSFSIETCPLCQKEFKSGMSQIDKDGHIAACFAASSDDVTW